MRDVYENLAESLGAGTLIVLSLVVIILSIIANWKLFEKAGKSGILSIIPFYHVFVEMEILNGKAWTALLYLIPPVAAIYAIVNTLRLAVCYNKGLLVGVLGIFFNLFVRIYLAFSEDTKYTGPKTLSEIFAKVDEEV